jgi:hypothetical protein
MSTPQPGWYDDPEDSKSQRYWDGQDWTPHRHQKPISQATPPPGLPAPPPPTGLPAQPAPPSPHQHVPWPPLGGWLPQKFRNPTVIAAGIGVAAVLAVVGWLAWPSSTNTGGTSSRGDHTGGGTSSPADTGSQESYNKGYEFGNLYVDKAPPLQILIGAGSDGYRGICLTIGRAGQQLGPGINEARWMHGCTDALIKRLGPIH